MISMESQSLLPYVPRLVSTWPPSASPPAHQQLSGSMVFADISGFTQMSERLARRGKVGAEEVVSVINSTFARLLAVAYGEAGGLLKFGGDALLLFFPGDDHELRAARSAARMRRTLREIGKITTSAGAVTLRISIGIHSGPFDFYLVGGSHHELIVAGPSVTRTVEMESEARAGDILLSPEAASNLPGRHRGEPKGPGILLKGTPAGTSDAPADIALHPTIDVAHCIPVAIREHLIAGGEGAAHRQVTVMFLQFGGVDGLTKSQGPEAVQNALDVLVRLIQEAAETHLVTFVDADIYRDGGKILLVGGAPVAHEDDEARVLLAARSIIEAKPPLPVRIGIHRGHVFTSDIGPAYRKTYTLMGDVVNLAARVMARADPGEILATDEVTEISGTAFEVEALAPFSVKGKAKAIGAKRIGPSSGRKRGRLVHRTPLVGREKEVATLLSALRQAQDGEGQFVEIVGEPGIGKSRLLDELIAQATGVRVLTVTCEPYGSSSAYFAFRNPLRSVVGIPVGAGEEEARSILRAVVTEPMPDLEPWLPLLAIPAGVEMASTPQIDRLEERFRKSKLEEVTGRMLGNLLPDPSLLIFEDSHWMDDASRDLLRKLAKEVHHRPWMICSTRREAATGFRGEDIPDAVVLKPEPLSPEATTALLNAATEESPLRAHEVQALAVRAGGNPLFIRELLEGLSEGGLETLPESVEKAIAVRIDRLPPQYRSALRRLSVLGPTFSSSLAAAVLDGEIDESDLWTRLSEFLDREESTLRFRHTLMRDAAYEALPYRLRQELHRMAADRIERAADDVEAEAAILSLHFFEGGRYEPAWMYARRAAEHAKKIYANVEATRLFERALEAARRLGGIPLGERVMTWESLGDVRLLVGEYERAAKAYRAARQLVKDDPLEGARLIRKHIRIPWRAGRLPVAIRWITRGLRVLEKVPGESASRERARLYAWYGGIRQQQARPAEAARWCRRAIDEAKASDAKDALAQASYILDLALMDMGRLEDFSNSETALAIYEELGELPGQANVLNNLGGFAYLQGRWDEALGYYERGRSAREAVGDAATAATGIYNIAEILSDQGRLEEAEERARDAFRVWKAAGDRARTGFAAALLARIAYRGGRYEEALPLLEESRSTLAYVGAASQVLLVDALTAECALLSGEDEAALKLAGDALDKAGSIGGAAVYAPLLLRLRGEALVKLGMRSEGRTDLEASLEAARARGLDYEIALTLLGLGRLGEGDAEAFEAEGVAILERLGVRSIPGAPAASMPSASPAG